MTTTGQQQGQRRGADRVANALARGQALAGRVVATGPASWTVPSQSDPAGRHAVALVGGRLACDCYAALAGHPCAHRAAVSLHLAAEAVAPRPFSGRYRAQRRFEAELTGAA